MARQLFGTDGIRGVAGEYPLDAATVYAVGMALGQWAVETHGAGGELLIGMDTRESGGELAALVAGGMERAGARVRFAGLITTPGVAWLARTQDFVGGVMISASHNPYRDNGIKVFDHSGFKLPDAVEQELEGRIFGSLREKAAPVAAELTVDMGLDAAYLDFLAGSMRFSLAGHKLVVDCANGAATHLGPALLRRLGAEVTALHAAPDGRNINKDCGALHVGSLQEAVKASGADAGIAFDGDADRAMMVSHSGRLVDGDAMLLVTASALHYQGRLADNEGVPTVVATVMSNMGFEVAFRERGIRMVRTAVGDKYVLEEMVRRGAPVGGEQSGHLIFREFATTGDGMLTGLRVLDAMRESGRDLDQLVGAVAAYPQLLVNVRVREKRPIEDLPAVQHEIGEAEAEFNGSGRVLVRYSGTEALARVMVEGREADRVRHHAHRIAAALERELA